MLLSLKFSRNVKKNILAFNQNLNWPLHVINSDYHDPWNNSWSLMKPQINKWIGLGSRVRPLPQLDSAEYLNMKCGKWSWLLTSPQVFQREWHLGAELPDEERSSLFLFSFNLDEGRLTDRTMFRTFISSDRRLLSPSKSSGWALIKNFLIYGSCQRRSHKDSDWRGANETLVLKGSEAV